MGELYSRFAALLQLLLIVCGTLLFIVAHPKTADILLHKALKPADITFEKIDGSLINGFTLYGVKYQKAVRIGSLEISYSPFRLLSPKPTIAKVAAERVRIYPERFKKRSRKKSGRSNFVSPPLLIAKATLKDAQIVSPETVKFVAGAEEAEISVNGVDVKKIVASIESLYGSAELAGTFKNMQVRATGTVTPSKRYMEKIGEHAQAVPKSLPVKLYSDSKIVKISTSIERKIGLKDANVSLSAIKAEMEYLLEDRYIRAKASYIVETAQLIVDVRQSLLATLFGAYATKIDGKIVKSVHALPFREFRVDAAGDPSILVADTYAPPFSLSIYSSDYRNFALHASAKPHTPSYIEHLPAIFSSQTISMDANATAHLLPEPNIEGVVSLDGNYSRTESYIELKKESLLVRSTVTPKDKKGGIWENLPDPLRTAVTTFIYISKEKKILNIVQNMDDLTLFEQNGNINGWANVGSLTLDASGRLHNDKTLDLTFNAQIDSLHKFLNEFNITTEPTIDAEIKSRFYLELADTFSLRYKTDIPWYLVEPDSQHIYYGLDNTLEGTLKRDRIVIESYSVAFKERRFTQKRPSVISLDENRTLHIEKLSLLDTLTARGVYSFDTAEGEFSLKGEKAHYSGPEGKITADVDITAEISPLEIAAEGEVFVREGLVTYRPKREYVVEDSDIVIIQDMKEPSHTKRRVNIHIYSKSPLKYKIPEVTAEFIPDITLWKEAGKPFGILGIVKIVDGTIKAADKRFTIEPSEVYFGGSYPVNPYLDLHIVYELDFYKFNIYVSHTLAKPLFLFSSEPPMSQNDIMSYILFGAPANEAFGSSAEPSGSIATMLLGMGLKNAIGSATGIRFDTLNLLSSENGAFGIEVGKRIGKRLRIIYRNDTVSSFIIQYKASRSIRIDVDVRDTGQGINILYVKEFGGKS